MALFKALRLAMCVALVAIAAIGSSVTHEGPVLLHEQNYTRVVGFNGAAAPDFRNFYVAVEKSRWRKPTDKDFIALPFETPSLSDGFSGSFLVDANESLRGGLASHFDSLARQPGSENLQLYLGFTPDAAATEAYKIPIGKLDLPAPGARVALIRFDIKRWHMAGGVVSYDIGVSYWGRPASDTQTVLALAEDASPVGAAPR